MFSGHKVVTAPGVGQPILNVSCRASGPVGRQCGRLFPSVLVDGLRFDPFFPITFTLGFFASGCRVNVGKLVNFTLAVNISDVPVTMPTVGKVSNNLLACVRDSVAPPEKGLFP